MNTKSHVTLEQRICLVCAKPYDTGALLLDQRLRARFDQFTCTGWGLCPEHQKLFDEGYVALVECDPQKSGLSATSQSLKPEEAYRTGRVAHLKRAVFDRLFQQPSPSTVPIAFIDPQVFEKLTEMSGE